MKYTLSCASAIPSAASGRQMQQARLMAGTVLPKDSTTRSPW